ncbi:hypothetical protein H0482_00055 [Devosia sp. CC-YST696]|nr:hypothetical protein [Devosia faecipullorum]
MSKVTKLSCSCGAVEMEADGSPIMSTECLCTSCRSAATTFERLPGAKKLCEPSGGTRTEMYRKDRVRCVDGSDHLREHRLTDQTKTRRVVATCCNTPMFLDFTEGHWIDLYSVLWPENTLPPLQMRTMAGDLDDPSKLPNDVPNLKSHSPTFFVRLIAAWIAMGFRRPKIDYVNGVLDISGK